MVIVVTVAYLLPPKPSRTANSYSVASHRSVLYRRLHYFWTGSFGKKLFSESYYLQILSAVSYSAANFR